VVARFWLVVCLLAAVPLHPQELSREEELDSLRLQIQRLQGHLARLGHERQGLRTELSRLNIQLELQQHRVREAATQGALAQEELLHLEAEVGDLEVELGRARSDLRGVLVRLYRTGEQGYLRLLLSLEEGDDVLDGLRQLRFLARRDSGALRRYVDTFDRLAGRRDLARRKAEEIEAWLVDERERRDELETLGRRQQELLTRVEREHRDVTVRTERLIEREQKLADLIELLAGRVHAPPQGDSIARFRGVLDWPVAGRLTQGFGPRLDPRYGTRVPHNGVELATAAGAAVRAIYGGNVLFAAPFEGYGLTAIVLHPGRVFSLYAGLAELEVAPDDVVSLGQVVGTAQGRLYFEIRVENRPEDPAGWLR
jgi:septal ring factor EnvC (AmiA/AmiB activator)